MYVTNLPYNDKMQFFRFWLDFLYFFMNYFIMSSYEEKKIKVKFLVVFKKKWTFHSYNIKHNAEK